MTNEKQTTDETPEPQTVTREELQTLKAQADSLASMLRKEREASAKRIGGIEEALKALVEQRAEKPADDGKPDPKMAAYEAKLREMETRLEAERKQREQVEGARLSQERRTALSNALTSKGVSGPHLKAALAYIYDAQGLVVHDDKGQVGLKMQRTGYDEIVPVEAGLDELFKQDDYRIFLPPRPAQGSGTVPGRPVAKGPHKMTKEEAMSMLIPSILKASG